MTNFEKHMKKINSEYITDDWVDNEPQQEGQPQSAAGQSAAAMGAIPIDAEQAPVATDMYNDLHNIAYEASKREYPNGARAKMGHDLEAATKGLGKFYHVAKSMSDKLKASGDVTRAQILRDQYMQEKFYPIIEALVRLNSADELLNASEALKQLDTYVLTDGGATSGFTRSYVKTLYQNELGNTTAQSDAVVRDGVRDLIMLTNRDQIRTAIGKAQKLLDKIDSGKQYASDDDYNLIMRVATR